MVRYLFLQLNKDDEDQIYEERLDEELPFYQSLSHVRLHLHSTQKNT